MLGGFGTIGFGFSVWLEGCGFWPEGVLPPALPGIGYRLLADCVWVGRRGGSGPFEVLLPRESGAIPLSIE